MNYQIEDKTGTLNINLPTLYGHILQHIEWGKEYLDWYKVQPEFQYCADILREKLWRMKIEPIVESDENYCGTLHSKKDKLVFEWESIFNYLLWDAAVTYCVAASENGGNQGYSFFAIYLFDIIWRLRRDLEASKRR